MTDTIPLALRERRRGAAHDLTSQRFGRLVVLHRNHERSIGRHSAYWTCVCDCGVVKDVRGDQLTRGNSPSCGCYGREVRHAFAKVDRNEVAFNQVWADYRRGARERKLEFCLTKAEFNRLIMSVCYYCGDSPSRSVRSSYKPTQAEIICNGVDRVDNTKGYTSDNCVPCCPQCNFAKQATNHDDFIDMCRKVASRHEQDPW